MGVEDQTPEQRDRSKGSHRHPIPDAPEAVEWARDQASARLLRMLRTGQIGRIVVEYRRAVEAEEEPT